MSSINSSDRARQTDDLRQAREEYQTSEVETAKRNKAEKQRMQERHEQEINRLREEYDNQIATLRNKHKETLTDRDQAHIDQVDKMKALYMEQMRRKTEESEAGRKEIARTLESELTQNKKVNQQQKETLTRDFREAMLERDAEFSEFQNRAKEKIQSSIEDRTKKLNEAHGKEVGVLIDDRDERVARLEKQRAEVQTTLGREIKDKDRKHRSDMEKTNEHWQTVVMDNDKIHDSILTNRNQLLQAERQSMQGKYQEAMERKMNQLDSAHDNLRDQVQGRLDSQVRGLTHDLERSKNDRVVDMITNRRLRDLEKRHVDEQYQDRMGELEKERAEILGVAKERTAEKVDQIVRRSDKIVQETNRSNRMKQNIQSQQSREDRTQLEFEMRSRLENANDQADKRVRRVQNVTNEEMKNQQVYHDQTLDQIKSNYAENLAAQREVQLESIQKVRVRAEERLHQVENKAAKKLEDTVTAYEAKIQKMEEDHKAEKARMSELFEQRVTQREKQLKTEQESQAIKYEAKLAAADELRQKEIARIERRNQEQMSDLNTRMKYLNSSKKG